MSNSAQKPLSPAENLRISEGLEIHKRARNLFPNGTMVFGENETCLKTTENLVSNFDSNIIFEATFKWQDFIAKADIIIRDGLRWKIIEVKSNIKGDGELINDLTYTTMVAYKAGLRIATCSLMLVNRDFRLGSPDEDLFIEFDCTELIAGKMTELKECSGNIAQILSAAAKPVPELKWNCRKCDLFSSCHNITSNHVFDLPNLRESKFNQLQNMGALDIEDIPHDFPLTPVQNRVKEAVIKKEPFIDIDGLKRALNSLEYPAYYLDFETMQTCIPLYEAVAPYSQIATQYSIHICNRNGIQGHKEYFSDPSMDCRRILAENLLRDLGSEGSIIVYSSFEKTIIKGLADLFPDLSKELNGLIERLVDLCAILKNTFYHPEFHGSYSIKKVLPVLVPIMRYDGMQVDNGLDASALFAYMAMGRYDETETNEIRASLLKYCNLDTVAMVRVVDRLRDVVAQ